MFTDANIIYEYDGSFEGFLCCVFESFLKKEIPNSIVIYGFEQTMLLPVKHIVTETEKYYRVRKWIDSGFSLQFNIFFNSCYLSCLNDKEISMLRFLILANEYGNSVLSMLTNPVVNRLMKAVKHLNFECERYIQFIRFTDYSGTLVSEIEPNNFVLPLIRDHFCQRLPNEVFLIYDSSHSMALTYKPYSSSIIPASDISFDTPGEEEIVYQELWRMYYNVISVEGRYNPKCRMSHMPKRYWKYMTEFNSRA